MSLTGKQEARRWETEILEYNLRQILAISTVKWKDLDANLILHLWSWGTKGEKDHMINHQKKRSLKSHSVATLRICESDWKQDAMWGTIKLQVIICILSKVSRIIAEMPDMVAIS